MKKIIVGIVGLMSLSMMAYAQADGADIYKQKCKKCHGDHGEGANPIIAKKLKLDPDKLALKPSEEKTDEELTKLITEGKDKMPDYAEKLTPDEIAAVLAHVRTLVPQKK